jgi:hypothetical protein
MHCTVLQRKQARFAIKVAYLHRVDSDLRTPSVEFNSSDALMIKTACGQVGSVGVKLSKRLPSETSYLLETEQLCNNIFGQIDAFASKMYGVISDLKAIDAFKDDRLTQFYGWELFLNQQNADSKQVGFVSVD